MEFDDRLRLALSARERFSPSPEAVLATVLSSPPKGPSRFKRSRRYFAATGIAAAVALIVGSLNLVRVATHDVTVPPVPAVPLTEKSDLAASLDRTYWSLATVTKGSGTPLSPGDEDTLSLLFNTDGTAFLAFSCGTDNVTWSATTQSITISKIKAPPTTCDVPSGQAPSAAAAPLAGAIGAMADAPTLAHPDGRSLVLQAGAYLVVLKYGFRESAVIDEKQHPSMNSVIARWASFPVTATPRPIVLMGNAVIFPNDPLSDGADESALAAGRFIVATTLPPTPATVNGYPILTAQEAIAQFSDPQPTGSPRSSLHITGVQLTHQTFSTDRSDQSLPAWKVTIAESHDPIFVLAVAAAGRFPATLANDPPNGEMATVSDHGTAVTIPFVAHHVSAGNCDPDYTSTFTSTETTTSVVMNVTTHFSKALPGCDGFSSVTKLPAPGQPDTHTLRLSKPLGNRVVVDGSGVPYTMMST